MKSRSGFTLVELLVVITIIGILSSVVFASLNGARQKARVAAGQAYMGALRPVLNLCRDAIAADGTPGVLNAYDATGNTDICTPPINAPWPTAPTDWTPIVDSSNGDSMEVSATCPADSCGGIAGAPDGGYRIVCTLSSCKTSIEESF